MGRRYKDNWTGALAAFRWPLGMLAGALVLWQRAQGWHALSFYGGGQVAELFYLLERVIGLLLAAAVVVPIAIGLEWLGMEPARGKRPDET